MKRNYIPFIAGMSTMLLLVGLVGASLAGETRPPAVPQSGTLNGQVAYGEAGVALFGKEQVPAGAAWTTEDGAQIPTVLTYTDENGRTTTSSAPRPRRRCWTWSTARCTGRT